MKILYYNWVQFDDASRRGGGVTVYQNNLIKEMVEKGHDVYFLSSGLAYNILRSKTYIRSTKSKIPECKTFEVVNSSVMAPSHSFWGGDEVFLYDDSMWKCFKEFVSANGPFDVVHFQNLEGLTLPLISNEIFGNARLFHSAHNYFSVCPQVNLWRYETFNCMDNNEGQSCTYCLPFPAKLKRTLIYYQIEKLICSLGIQRGSDLFSSAFRFLLRFRGTLHLLNRLRYFLFLKRSSNPIWRLVYGKKNFDQWRKSLSERRAKVAESFSQNYVTTIAVSQRTREVISKFGLEGTKLVTSYIGTRHTETFKSASKVMSPRVVGQFSICYLGYMRRDKGFYFFLECLDLLPLEVASQVNVVVAAKNAHNGSLERLMYMNNKFRSVKYYDGFNEKDLDEILKTTDLGIVPVLWEDNLPQVAIEIVSRGVPILTSDLGGAQEIVRNPLFTFRANDHRHFNQVLKGLVAGKLPLSDFWTTNPQLYSMDDHSKELMEMYMKPGV